MTVAVPTKPSASQPVSQSDTQDTPGLYALFCHVGETAKLGSTCRRRLQRRAGLPESGRAPGSVPRSGNSATSARPACRSGAAAAPHPCLPSLRAARAGCSVNQALCHPNARRAGGGLLVSGQTGCIHTSPGCNELGREVGRLLLRRPPRGGGCRCGRHVRALMMMQQILSVHASWRSADFAAGRTGVENRTDVPAAMLSRPHGEMQQLS